MGVGILLYFTYFVHAALTKSQAAAEAKTEHDSDVAQGAAPPDIVPLDVVTVATDFMVYTGLLSSVHLKWSDTMKSILVGSTAASGVQVAHASPISCLLASHTPAMREFLFFFALLCAGPLALCALVWIANRCGKSAALRGHDAKRWMQHAWAVAAILFQPTITKQVFALLPTIKIDGASYMANDMAVAVGSPAHHSVLLFAVAVLVIFVLGIPLAVLRVLRNPSSRLGPSFAFLFKSFDPDKRWWAVMVIWRKTAITAAVSVLRDSWEQLYVATWILALTLVSHLTFVPYGRKPALQALETKMLSSATVLMALALAIPIGFEAGSPIGIELAMGALQLGTLLGLVVLAVRRVDTKSVRAKLNAVRNKSSGGMPCNTLEQPLLAEEGRAEAAMKTSNVAKYAVGQRVSNLGAHNTSGTIVRVVADNGNAGPGMLFVVPEN
jgi:hypothetical protein